MGHFILCATGVNKGRALLSLRSRKRRPQITLINITVRGIILKVSRKVHHFLVAATSNLARLEVINNTIICPRQGRNIRNIQVDLTSNTDLHLVRTSIPAIRTTVRSQANTLVSLVSCRVRPFNRLLPVGIISNMVPYLAPAPACPRNHHFPVVSSILNRVHQLHKHNRHSTRLRQVTGRNINRSKPHASAAWAGKRFSLLSLWSSSSSRVLLDQVSYVT